MSAVPPIPPSFAGVHTIGTWPRDGTAFVPVSPGRRRQAKALADRGMTKPRNIAVCIGCGCDDLHACVRDVQLDDLVEPNFEDGFLVEIPRKVATVEACHWLRVDRDAGLGVCSACPGSVERWDAGERDLVVNFGRSASHYRASAPGATT